MAVLAVKAYEEGKSSSAAELHAVYVRASDAEINERWQQEKARGLRSDLEISIEAMTEHDLLEVCQIEDMSQLSAWGWDAYHKELESAQDTIMLVAQG